MPNEKKYSDRILFISPNDPLMDRIASENYRHYWANKKPRSEKPKPKSPWQNLIDYRNSEAGKAAAGKRKFII